MTRLRWPFPSGGRSASALADAATHCLRLGLRSGARAAFLSWSLIAAGCSGDASVLEEIKHPHPTDLRRPTGTRPVTIGLGNGAPALNGILGSLAAAQSLATIGVEDGPPDQAIGKTEDVVFDASGNLFVLDSHFSQVRLFGSDGKFRGAVGGPGRGAGQFRNPVSVTVDEAGVIYVGGIDRRIVTFEPDDVGYRPGRELHLPVAPRDMCWLGGELIVHGVNHDDGTILHRYNADGRLISSFGVVYGKRNPLVMSELSRGAIACLTEPQLIVFAPKSVLAEVRAYRPDGDLAWLGELSGYKPMNVTEQINIGMSVRVPPDGFNRLHQLAAVGPNRILLQVAFVKDDVHLARGLFTSVRSLVLDGSTGASVEFSSTAPGIRGIAPDGRALVVGDGASQTLQIMRAQQGA